MSLPVPNLDDRSWKQIVDEAIRLIPRYTPEWTNHNPSDPGVTLMELYAWMTEMVIYRLNKVPEKNFLTFLDLIGVTLLPPEPAKAVLEITPVEGAEGELVVPKGTQIATQQSGGGDPVTFETVKDLTLVPVNVSRAVSAHKGAFTDHTMAFADEAAEPRETIFQGVAEVERFLYVGDEQLVALNEESAIDVVFEMMPGYRGPTIPQLTEWQYWDGKRWREMMPNRAESGPNRIAFNSHPGIEKTEVNGIETFWIRGKLTEPLQDPRNLQLESISLRVEILGEGLAAENLFTNIGAYIFLPVDQGKSFFPFGEEPKFDHALYIAHKEMFSAPDARIRIEMGLTDPSAVEPPQPSPDLQILWEYWNGKKWAELGRTTPMGVSGHQGQWQFLDSTGAFARSGAVSFNRPPDMHEIEVGGVVNVWIRARINQGNFGAPGAYERIGENWVFKEDRPLRPPCLKTLVFKYVREPKFVEKCMSYNDFHFRDHTDDVLQPYVYFQPFLPDPDENPALYIGGDKAYPRRTCRLYFHLDEEAEPGGADLEATGLGPRVVWEYWNGERWADLLPVDGTRGFTRSGYVEFTGQRDQALKTLFESDAFWIRARLETGAYDRAPVVRAVMVNAVDAVNGITVGEIVGSSDGTAGQEMVLANQPILAGWKLTVLEADPPSPQDKKILIAEEGEDCLENDPEGGGTWVRWHLVDHFFESGPTSRHYLMDPITGKVTFGDGRNGMVPPVARDNIKCEYRIGGGKDGNTGARTLIVLKQAIAFIEKVTNPFPAHGGADAETLDEAKRRGTYAIKNRDRAVTAEDYELLATAASRKVSRAKCVQARDGSVSLLIVPKAGGAEGRDGKVIPSRDLLDRVEAYIDKRRLITARVHVGKPRYLDVSLDIVVALKAGATADRVKAEVVNRVRKLMHPLEGGPKSEGWPFGRDVGKSDLYAVIEGVDGVDRVSDLTIIDESRRLRVETLKINDDELPNLVSVDISER